MIPLANHLWQSTLFACTAGLLTLTLSRHRAAIRYWLWLAASLKFLLPFSLLIALGASLQWRPARAAIPLPAIPVMIDEISRPFTPSVYRPADTSAPIPAPAILFTIWAIGSLILAIVTLRKYRRVRTAIRAASPIPLDLALPVVSSPALLEPGVFGIFRPRLLLPAGILTRLTPPQLEAIIAHELCHVRRRDNLTAAVHMLVETVFWFHPLIWWIGTRLLTERERACDEEVLRQGSEPRVYAESILRVCEFYLESPLPCVAGVTGANLQQRIRGILKNHVSKKLNASRKLLLAAVGLLSVMTPVTIGLTHAPAVRAQSEVMPVPKFEVASIRAGCAPRAANTGSGPQRMVVCTTLRTFIRDAYGLYQDGRPHRGYLNAGAVPIEGGPSWINADRFTINAKAEAPASFEMLHGPMLQVLLEDRFKLKIHRESRDGPAYALTVAKGGPKLHRPLDGSCVTTDASSPPLAQGQVPCGPEPPRPSPSGPNFVTMVRGYTLDDFATVLFSMLDRPVINRTGIAGRFDFRLEYMPDGNTPMILSWLAERQVAAGADPNGIAILSALQEQLGLKLQPTKASREYLVIDHAEKPTSN